MGIAKVEDLDAWQRANSFKLEVYRLLRRSRDAASDFRFRAQLRDAAASAEMVTLGLMKSLRNRPDP